MAHARITNPRAVRTTPPQAASPMEPMFNAKRATGTVTATPYETIRSGVDRWSRLSPRQRAAVPGTRKIRSNASQVRSAAIPKTTVSIARA